MRSRDDDFPDNGFEAWGGYMQAKISKLEDQFSDRAEQGEKLSNIFNGISIYVNGYTKPSSDELKQLMVKHGGVYHTYQRKEDIIIASNLPDTKVKNMTLSRIVKPEWITDSISANKLLNYSNYLLYGNSRTQPKLKFVKANDKLDFCTNNTFEPQLFIESELKEESLISNSNNKNENALIESCSFTSTSSTNTKSVSTKTAADPNFISEFYSNSRLHHISQLGACFKQHINDLRETSNFNFPLRHRLADDIEKQLNRNTSQTNFHNGKTIMHIDMDCFFVSVGLRNRPDLRGKPVAVTHSKGGQPRAKRAGVDRNVEFNLYKQRLAQKLGKSNLYENNDIGMIKTRVDDIGDEDDKFGSMSEIASCSYEARSKGVSNGMFMGAALKLVPDLQTIPYDFEGYKEVAYTLYNTVAQYTLDIEAVSCDEMYVDCTELLNNLNVSVQDFATALRQEIKEKTGCPCSTGFGGNRLQARLATKHAKPDGQFFLVENLVEDFMYDIKLKDLPGVGRQTAQKLEALGHHSCGSLQSLPLKILQQHLGNKTGLQLYDQCRGNDANPLTYFTVRKSVSAEVNYGIRFENQDQCLEFLKQLSNEIQTRMNQFKVVGKCITLKLMVRSEDAPVETAKFMGHGFCNVINKSISLTTATNDGIIIFNQIVAIYKNLLIDPKEMRGIGIQITKLESCMPKITVKGVMDKYFNKQIKPEGLKNVSVSVEEINKNSSKIIKDDIYTTPKKNCPDQSPTKQSTITGVLHSPLIAPSRSPARRRGRPPKSLSLSKLQEPKNLISNFLMGSNKNALFPKDEIVPTNINPQECQVKLEPDKQIGLLGLPWKRVRELIRAWLDSGQAPLKCDIKMIASYMCNMVIQRDLQHLNILLNFLGRSTHEINCDKWNEVYNKIVEEVQHSMIAIYGKTLLLNYETI